MMKRPLGRFAYLSSRNAFVSFSNRKLFLLWDFRSFEIRGKALHKCYLVRLGLGVLLAYVCPTKQLLKPMCLNSWTDLREISRFSIGESQKH